MLRQKIFSSQNTYHQAPKNFFKELLTFDDKYCIMQSHEEKPERRSTMAKTNSSVMSKSEVMSGVETPTDKILSIVKTANNEYTRAENYIDGRRAQIVRFKHTDIVKVYSDRQFRICNGGEFNKTMVNHINSALERLNTPLTVTMGKEKRSMKISDNPSEGKRIEGVFKTSIGGQFDGEGLIQQLW